MVAADRTVFKGPAVSLVLPGVDGYLGVLHGHAPLVTALAIGVITITQPDNHTGNHRRLRRLRRSAAAENHHPRRRRGTRGRDRHRTRRLAQQRAEERLRTASPGENIDVERAKSPCCAPSTGCTRRSGQVDLTVSSVQGIAASISSLYCPKRAALLHLARCSNDRWAARDIFRLSLPGFECRTLQGAAVRETQLPGDIVQQIHGIQVLCRGHIALSSGEEDHAAHRRRHARHKQRRVAAATSAMLACCAASLPGSTIFGLRSISSRTTRCSYNA